MSLTVIAAVFPLVFLAELPDKTMFASLLMASRGRPMAVWLGASMAFAVHVAIAVSIGATVFRLLPHRAADAVAAVIFLGGAMYAYLSRHQTLGGEHLSNRSGLAVTMTAAAVIFLAEWGDLTQILTANLAVTYRSWLSVGVGALAALVAVAAVAVIGGSRLLARLDVRWLRLATAVAFLGLAAYSAVQAAS